METNNRTIVTVMTIHQLFGWMEDYGKKLFKTQEDFYYKDKSKQRANTARVLTLGLVEFINSRELDKFWYTLLHIMCHKPGISEDVFAEKSSTIQRFSAALSSLTLLLNTQRNEVMALMEVERYESLSEDETSVLHQLVCWTDDFFNEDTGFYYPTLRLARDYYRDQAEKIEFVEFVYVDDGGPDPEPLNSIPAPWQPIYATNPLTHK
jgi:hypothetical protein